MKLRKTHTFRMLDDHERRIRHVDTDLDHCRRDEQLNFTALE